MQKTSINFIIIITTLCMLLPIFILAQGNEVAKVESAALVIDEIMNIPEESIPPSLMDQAYGVAVIPDVIKVGLGIGGRYGKGILVMRTRDNRWSDPAFITLTGGSIGWQIGVQSTDIILVFKTRKSVDAVIEGEFTLGADASVAAGPVGRHVGAKTDVEFKAEIYSYSKSRGLFAGLALEGAAIQIDHDANEDFYDQPYISVDDIFSNRVKDIHECANTFRQTLNAYTNTMEEEE